MPCPRQPSPLRRYLHASAPRGIDRKSTRLNSSHSQISYAVFCLKKKKKLKYHAPPHLHFLRLLASSYTLAFRTLLQSFSFFRRRPLVDASAQWPPVVVVFLNICH